jgi:PPOX class probable F420-dependent enzyme
MPAAPTIPDSHADLLDAAGVATLSTIGPDGRPQVTAIWYVRDGDVVRMSALRSRQKYRNVAARPQATLFLLDPANPYRTLEIRGDVALEDDADLAFFTQVAHRYGSEPEAFPTDGRVILTLIPRHVSSFG